MSTPTINLRAVEKSFPGIKALDRIDLRLEGGEVHALLGENGAGKSTLARIIGGAFAPDGGEIEFKGAVAHWRSPRQAKQFGIHTIHQELALFPDLSVAENIMIGNERTRAGLIDKRAVERDAREALRRLGADIDTNALVGDLSVADQQMVEIAKALVGKVELIIFDEPTAVISGREVVLLFDNIRRLKAQGVAIVYISHRLEELFEIADKVTVLKDGKKVDTRLIGEVDRDTLVRLMVGRELKDIYPAKRTSAPEREVLRVENLASGDMVRDASLVLHAGEVLGLAGMVGSGRSELAHAIFGGTPIHSGNVFLDGAPVRFANPRQAIKAGMGLLTEDRKRQGLFLLLSVAANIVAARLSDIYRNLFLDRTQERKIAEDSIRAFSVAARSPQQSVRFLSGGNQQKTLFGRWSRVVTTVLILDEPTRGVDVGAKVDIYRLIREMAARGLGILVISSELLEVLGLCDRVVVMREGRNVGELSGTALTEENIMKLAVGNSAAAAPQAMVALP